MNQPEIEFFNKISVKTLKNDILAAVTVTIMLIPQGMAYAMLAGLPPIYGLYASFVPLLVYPLFGSSRFLSVGPVALVSIIMLSGLSALAEPGSSEYIQLAILTSLVAGVIQVILWAFRMGWLVNYLSEPVIVGFTTAAALIITITQIKSMFGLDIPRNINTLLMLKSIVTNIQGTNVMSLAIGISSLGLILAIKKINKKIPGALLAIVLGTLAVWYFKLYEFGVDIVGTVPSGLPKFSYDFINYQSILDVLPLALVICLISFIESLAIAKALAAKNQEYNIDSNKELLGLGMAKMLGSFFQGFPNTGSFSRSAINEQAGASSALASIFAAILVGITLLFLTPLFQYLPKPVLAAIIIAAVVGLINIPYSKKLFKIDRKDFYVLLTTLCLTLILGVQKGVFAGVILSVILILYKSARPHYAVLGQLPGTNIYRNINRFSDALQTSGTLIMRYDDDLFFGNADHFYDTVMKEIDKYPNTKRLIIEFSSINKIDSTALSKLDLLLTTLKNREVKLILTGVIGPIRDLFKKSGFYQAKGEDYYFTIQDAVDEKQNSSGRITKIPSDAFKK